MKQSFAGLLWNDVHNIHLHGQNDRPANIKNNKCEPMEQFEIEFLHNFDEIMTIITFEKYYLTYSLNLIIFLIPFIYFTCKEKI